MIEIFGEIRPAFVFVTLMLSLCAWLGGGALAGGWSGVRPVIVYAVLLSGAHRFLVFGLAGGTLLSVAGFALSVAFFVALMLFSWRWRLAEKVVAQYPWMYARRGPLGWRDLSEAEAEAFRVSRIRE